MYNSKFRHREEEELRKRIGRNYKIMNLEKNLYFIECIKPIKQKKKMMSNFKKNYHNFIIKLDLYNDSCMYSG